MPNASVDHLGLFEQIYQHVPFGIALLSIDGSCIKANPAFCRIIGSTEEELSAASFLETAHPDDREETSLLFAELVREGLSSCQTDRRFIRNDGALVWASLYISSVMDDPGDSPLYYMTHLIDITKRKEAEQKLLEVQDSYNLISENARDIIYFSTPDGVCRYISPSITDLLGYKPEEMIGKTNFEHYHPDDIAGLIARKPSEEEALTYRLRHADGRYLWFETSFRLIRSELGEVEKVFAIGRDVTERKKHEDSLAEAQRIAQLGSWEWDVPLNEVTYSEEVYRMHGMEPRKSITQPVELLSLVHPSDQGELLEAFSRAFEGKPISLEYRHVDTEDGESVKYFHIRGAITRDKSGVVVRMNGTIQDVTERKLVEFRLQETIERYNSLKKYNHDAVFSLDLNGNFLNSNKMATRLTGYSPQEMAGMPYSQIFETNKSFSLHDGETDNWESELNRIRHQDGHTTEILTTIAPIIISEKTIGYYIIAKDITEQKKLLIEKETAERTNKAKSNFFAMMSHEIRTPMNGVIGMADLLMETSLDAEQQEYISVIRRSGESLINIINDILDFSKIEFGHTKLAMEPFEIRQCLAETMTLLSPLAKKKDLRMEVTVAENVPKHLIGDCERLKQVLTNLVGNAVKYTNQGGVSVTMRAVWHTQERMRLEFAVTDTGIGIPPDRVNQLFEPFSQLDTFMNRTVGGTGLGLAISKKLVELMDGEIDVQPAAGGGSVFVFTVLLETGDLGAGGAEPEGTEHADEQSLAILIAEDNEINQLVLQRLLEKMGHRTTMATNGIEAVEAARNGRFDLILMDVQMPEMNGLDAAGAIKRMLSGECPPIIAVTANASSQDRDSYLAAGMDDYLSKPLKGELLRAAVDRHSRRYTR